MEQASLRQLVEQLAKRVDNLESEVRFLRSLNGLQTEENDADHAAAAEDTVVDLTEPSAEDERVFAELGFLERVKATRDARGKKADDKATGMNADVEEELQTVPEEEVVVDNAAEDDDDHKKVLDRSIKLRLKPHQKIGVRFIYNILRDGRGFVLGDAMGLGKTLQILTALHMLIAARRATSTRASTATASLRALIVCPTMLLRHWESEVTQFNSWLSSSATPLPQPWVIDAALPPGIRMETLRTWSRRGGILLVGYDMLRELCGTTVGHELLCLHPGADVMVLDEGHRIRNFASSLHSVLSFVQVRSKIVLSGFPLQNNLTELYSMLEFVMPDLVHTVLGPLKSFQYHFEKAIQVWRKMKTKAPRAKRRAWLLFDLLQNHRLMLRRDSRILDEQLPPKTHIVIRLRMSALQKRLYDAFVRQSSEGNSERSSFDIFAVTSMISDHPDVAQQTANGACNPEMSAINRALRRPWLSAELKRAREEDGIKNVAAMCHSGKMVILMSLILECKRAGDQLVVFSRWLQSLSFVERMINQFNQMSIRGGGPSICTLRFDGSTALSERNQLISDFMAESSTADVMLVSTLCGEGISLVSANRVVILDVNWNPSHDQQAALRVFRYGQTKEVFIYRFVAVGVLEELVFQRQLKKMELSDWVLDRGNAATEYLDQQWAEFQDFAPSLDVPLDTADIQLSPKTMQDAVTRTLVEKHSVGEGSTIRTASTSAWILTAEEHNELLAEDVVDADNVDQRRAKDELEWETVYERKVRSKAKSLTANKPEGGPRSPFIPALSSPLAPSLPSASPKPLPAPAVSVEAAPPLECSLPSSLPPPPPIPSAPTRASTSDQVAASSSKANRTILDSVRHLKSRPNEGKQPERVVDDGPSLSSEVVTVVPAPTLRGIAKVPADSDSATSKHVASVDAITRPSDTAKRISTPQAEAGDQHQHLQLQQQLHALKANDHFAKLAEQRKQIKDDTRRRQTPNPEVSRKRKQEQRHQGQKKQLSKSKARKQAKYEKLIARKREREAAALRESSTPAADRRPPLCLPHGDRGKDPGVISHGDRNEASVEQCRSRTLSGSSLDRVFDFGYRRFDPSNKQEHARSR